MKNHRRHEEAALLFFSSVAGRTSSAFSSSLFSARCKRLLKGVTPTNACRSSLNFEFGFGAQFDDDIAKDG